jgi:hypothetical protein
MGRRKEVPRRGPETYRQHTNGWMSKNGKEYAWRQKGGKMATDP